MTDPKKESYHACFTGDCGHYYVDECNQAFQKHCAELEALAEQNRILENEVSDLKGACRAYEEIFMSIRNQCEKVVPESSDNVPDAQEKPYGNKSRYCGSCKRRVVVTREAEL